MRFYNQPHAAYCGVDLHARTMYLHVLDGVCSWYLGGKWSACCLGYLGGGKFKLSPCPPRLLWRAPL